MASTYVSYLTYTRNIERTLTRIGSSPQVAREAQYYLANIGKVKSVDDLLKNDRLYNYAMTAHGLSDMIGSKAFMRKVLESDLTDQRSFARSLVDQRFAAFARAFDFTTDGSVRANAQLVQTEAQEDATTGLYSEHRLRNGEKAATDAEYYQARIGALTNVDQFLRDDRLFSYALKAHGLEPKYASSATIRDVLTSDISDPASRANQLGGAYVELRNAFAFATDGSVIGSAQSQAQIDDTVYRSYEATGNGASPAAAAFKTHFYEASIANVASVDEFLANDRLYEYALTAFGLDPVLESKIGMRLVLTSDLSDPSSPANSLADTRYRQLAAAFNFATDGSIVPGETAQSAAQLEDTTERYLTTYDDKAAKSDSSATSYFEGGINKLGSVDELFADKKLYAYLLTAYGLDPEIESRSTIRRALESDVTDPRSFANAASDERYRNLAAAVNFATGGKVATARLAQLEREELATVRLYSSNAGTGTAEQDKARAEAVYYHDAMGGVASVDDLLADKRLVRFILKAYELDNAGLSDRELRQVLTSDPFDKKSFVNAEGDARLRTLAAAFNFNADGLAARAPAQEAQTEKDRLGTSDLFLRQTMETEAGGQSESVRLALYFQRKASSIGTAFDILADKALIQVVRTALGLPESFSQADIDVQARTLSRRLDFDDFKDPTKLEKFIARFSALYDMNTRSAAATPASILLGGSTDTGFSQTLLSSLQNVRPGRF